MTPGQATVLRDARQAVVIEWVRLCFGQACAASGAERGARVLEEAIELAQAAGLSEERAHHLVRHVFSKPVGEIGQEIGGVGITLLSFSAWAGLSAETEEVREFERIMSLPVEHFQKRHIEKAADGITMAPTPAAGAAELYRRAVELVTLEKNASVSFVQRRLGIGYNRAAQMIEAMECEGLVTAPDEHGKRAVNA